MADTNLSLTPRLIQSGTTRPRQRTPLANGCLWLSVAGLAATMLIGRPELLALTAPFLVATLATLLVHRASRPDVVLRFESRRVIEGDRVDLHVEITSDVDLPRVEVEVEFSDGLTALSATRMIGSVSKERTAVFVFAAEASRWGMADITSIRVHTVDRFGMFSSRWDFRCSESLQVVLPDHRLRRGLTPDRYRRIVGGHVSTDRGEGLELADIRPFQPGDAAKNINWRISNRRGEPWVTLRHPDQSATLVVVVDLDDDQDLDGTGTRRRATSGALALARNHLALQDRVGLLIVGRNRRWIPPELGTSHLYRLGDALVTVGNTPGASMRSYQPAPAGAIPSNAIIVAFSPLTDPLVVGLLARLRRHGNPVSVIQPRRAADRPRYPTRRWIRREDHERLTARRLAELEVAVAVERLQDRSITVIPWSEDLPAEAVIDTLRRTQESVRRTTGGRPVSA